MRSCVVQNRQSSKQWAQDSQQQRGHCCSEGHCDTPRHQNPIEDIPLHAAGALLHQTDCYYRANLAVGRADWHACTAPCALSHLDA